jgi:hypothetical protein
VPLRRSPVLTPAALRARRLNALKSTGPRTALGKQRSAANLLRTWNPFWGRRMSRQDRIDYFAPSVPPELLWFDNPGRLRMAMDAEVVGSRRRVRERDLQAVGARWRRLAGQPSPDGREPPAATANPRPAPATDNRQVKTEDRT